MRNIPNFITSLNLAAGFTAIIFAANADIVTASFLILAAMIFDFLDGFSSRLLKAYSEIGKELDSLADVVSFGVAPGLIIYKLLNDALLAGGAVNNTSDNLRTVVIIIIPVIMPVCAAIRLAIFNIDTSQATTFKGLPTPANALAVVSVVIAGHYSHSTIFSSFMGSPVFLSVFTVILSLLMVSRIPLLSLKMSNFRFKGNEGRFILIGSLVVSFAVFRITATPLIIPLYILVSLFSLLF